MTKRFPKNKWDVEWVMGQCAKTRKFSGKTYKLQDAMWDLDWAKSILGFMKDQGYVGRIVKRRLPDRDGFLHDVYLLYVKQSEFKPAKKKLWFNRLTRLIDDENYMSHVDAKWTDKEFKALMKIRDQVKADKIKTDDQMYKIMYDTFSKLAHPNKGRMFANYITKGQVQV